jgi:putative salt-induced outer membrane protein YdiY
MWIDRRIALRLTSSSAGWLLTAVLMTGMVLALPAIAQETSWQPPEPSPKSKDWIKLTSGEWLRGNIDLFRDDVLYFDSDELDDLEIDWGDIAEIRSPQMLTYTFYEAGTATGTCSMRDGIIKINTGTNVLEFDRMDLSSVLEGQPRELNFWSLKATLGIIARSGNSKQTDMNAYLRLRREATRSRFDLSYTGNVGAVEEQRNVNNHIVASSFNFFVSRRLFLTPLAAELFSDEFGNIDYRATLGVGVGYFLWRGGDFDFFLQLGGGYQAVRYLSVEPEQDQKVENGAVIPILNIEWDITSDIEFDIDYNAQIGLPDTKNAFHNLFTLLSIELSSYLDWDTSFQWNHNENPVADAEGNVPKRDDYRISVGLGVDL